MYNELSEIVVLGHYIELVTIYYLYFMFGLCFVVILVKYFMWDMYEYGCLIYIRIAFMI